MEVYKGLIQGSNLKPIVKQFQSDIFELEKAIELDKSIQNDLKNQINKLNNIISDKNLFIENQRRQSEIELAKLKDSNKKKFGIGIVGGYGLSTGTTTYQSFIGVGISYSLFRF